MKLRARPDGSQWSGEKDDSQVVGEGAEAAGHGAQSSPGAVSASVSVTAARGRAHGRGGRCLRRGAAHAQAENEDPHGKRGHHRGFLKRCCTPATAQTATTVDLSLAPYFWVRCGGFQSSICRRINGHESSRLFVYRCMSRLKRALPSHPKQGRWAGVHAAPPWVPYDHINTFPVFFFRFCFSNQNKTAHRALLPERSLKNKVTKRRAKKAPRCWCFRRVSSVSHRKTVARAISAPRFV